MSWSRKGQLKSESRALQTLGYLAGGGAQAGEGQGDPVGGSSDESRATEEEAGEERQQGVADVGVSGRRWGTGRGMHGSWESKQDIRAVQQQGITNTGIPGRWRGTVRGVAIRREQGDGGGGS